MSLSVDPSGCTHDAAVMRIVALVGYLVCPCGVVNGPYLPERAREPGVV